VLYCFCTAFVYRIALLLCADRSRKPREILGMSQCGRRSRSTRPRKMDSASSCERGQEAAALGCSTTWPRTEEKQQQPINVCVRRTSETVYGNCSCLLMRTSKNAALALAARPPHEIVVSCFDAVARRSLRPTISGIERNLRFPVRDPSTTPCHAQLCAASTSSLPPERGTRLPIRSGLNVFQRREIPRIPARATRHLILASLYAIVSPSNQGPTTGTIPLGQSK
jgi:hypothetical protein